MEQDPELLKNQSKEDELYELGQWVGRKQAFGLIAGRTAAADVECLRRIRDGKLYRAKGVDWTEFCKQYGGVTRSYADRLIRQLEEFGPNYFHLSQLVRITADTYRQIAPAVSGEGIAFGGETIAITPENSHKIAGAVNALRTVAPAKRRRVEAAGVRFDDCLDELTELAASELNAADRHYLGQVIRTGRRVLRSLQM